MRILVATDAWCPQVNGVVRTLEALADAARPLGAELVFLTPLPFRTVALPTYPDLRLALPSPGAVARLIDEARADAVHIATEGPVGLAARRHCLRAGLSFTTSFHTRFPDYVSARWPVPKGLVWALLRWFHRPSRRVLAATPALAAELAAQGFDNVHLWTRGVDANRFRPRPGADLGLPRPIFLSVGRLAVEKNLAAFLSLDLPGTKVVVGDGPQPGELVRRFPDAAFLGAQQGDALARTYAAADVFVFPSRTDTFGLVLLEALASGLPVAAFPVGGPRDVIGDAPVGVLDEDLGAACRRALALSPAACRAFALAMSWQASADRFLEHADTTTLRRRPRGRSAALAVPAEAGLPSGDDRSPRQVPAHGR